MEIVVEFIVLILELIWGTIKLLQKLSRIYFPMAFYYTSVALIPALTFRKIAVEYPRNSTNVAWGLRKWIDKSPQGKTILSPALGEFAGLLFWIAAAALAFAALSSPAPPHALDHECVGWATQTDFCPSYGPGALRR